MQLKHLKFIYNHVFEEYHPRIKSQKVVGVRLDYWLMLTLKDTVKTFIQITLRRENTGYSVLTNCFHRIIFTDFFSIFSLIFFPLIFQRFSTPPTILVIPSHQDAVRPQDALVFWVEASSQDSFKICLREVKLFDGLHKNIKIVRNYCLFLINVPYNYEMILLEAPISYPNI